MQRKGEAFVAAAILLRKRRGNEYVVLHLLCQGLEVVLKSFLLLRDYDKYGPQLGAKKASKKSAGKPLAGHAAPRLVHDLETIVDEVLAAFKLKPLPTALRSELSTLNDYYKRHLLRYGSIVDIFVDPTTIGNERVLRRLMAAIRLARRGRKPDHATDG